MVEQAGQNGKGAKAAFYSSRQKPEILNVYLDGIPESLRVLNRWVCWKLEWNGKKWDKPLYNPITGRLAKSNDPSTWTTFFKARARFEDGDKYDGIGIILGAVEEWGGAVLSGMDLDDCHDPETGELTSQAEWILGKLDTYSEISPSGTGIKCLCVGSLPEGRRSDHDAGIEMYASGRYFCITGRRLLNAPPEPQERQEILKQLHAELLGDKSNKSQTTDSPMSDQELALSALAGLSASRADGYSALIAVGMCLHAAGCSLGDWDSWSRKSEKYVEGECKRKWDGFKRGGGLGLGTLVHWAKEDGWQPPTRPSANGRAHQTSSSTGGKAPSTNGKVGQDHDDYHLTDLGNAKRVVARHGPNWRHCHPFKKNFIFEGKRWLEDDTGAAMRLVKETQRDLYESAAKRIAEMGKVSDTQRKAELAQLSEIIDHCIKWEDARRIEATLKLATTEPEIPVLPSDLDRDPWLLNVKNGTIDLRTGQFREHRREDLITKLAPVEYAPTAASPLWLKSLQTWMQANERLITYLQRAVGYSLTGLVSEQCLFFLFGSGCNGKSTLLATLLKLLGDYGLQSVPELLMQRNHEGHPTERADLFGRRLVATVEIDEGRKLAESLTKQLTGGDRVTARKMRQDFFQFDPTWKIWLAANHKPQIRGVDLAVWRRVKMIPFQAVIFDEQKDKNLLAKLIQEGPGILNWALRGCLDWQADGLAEPQEVTDATAAYRAEQDALAGFLAECCFLHDSAKCRSSVLFEAYQKWSGDKVMNSNTFRQQLNEKGYHSERGHGGGYYWQGIGLEASSGEGG